MQYDNNLYSGKTLILVDKNKNIYFQDKNQLLWDVYPFRIVFVFYTLPHRSA